MHNWGIWRVFAGSRNFDRRIHRLTINAWIARFFYNFEDTHTYIYFFFSLVSSRDNVAFLCAVIRASDGYETALRIHIWHISDKYIYEIFIYIFNIYVLVYIRNIYIYTWLALRFRISVFCVYKCHFWSRVSKATWCFCVGVTGGEGGA